MPKRDVKQAIGSFPFFSSLSLSLFLIFNIFIYFYFLGCFLVKGTIRAQLRHSGVDLFSGNDPNTRHGLKQFLLYSTFKIKKNTCWFWVMVVDGSTISWMGSLPFPCMNLNLSWGFEMDPLWAIGELYIFSFSNHLANSYWISNSFY